MTRGTPFFILYNTLPNIFVCLFGGPQTGRFSNSRSFEIICHLKAVSIATIFKQKGYNETEILKWNIVRRANISGSIDARGYRMMYALLRRSHISGGNFLKMYGNSVCSGVIVKTEIRPVQMKLQFNHNTSINHSSINSPLNRSFEMENGRRQLVTIDKDPCCVELLSFYISWPKLFPIMSQKIFSAFTNEFIKFYCKRAVLFMN